MTSLLNRLKTLPRDSRDTLFLLAIIAWVILPQVSNLPLWCSLLAAAVLLWRGWLAWTVQPLPSRWWLLALVAVTMAATWFTHRTLLGRDAGVTLIVVLLTLKTLELRARRDAFVVFFLSFFTMLTHFFFSQSLLTAAAVLIALSGLLTALVNAHMPAGKPPLLQAAKTAGWMMLLGAPVMAVLFVLFPRFAPLWGIPSDGMSGRSGLSATMQVGSIASLALDDSIALRVRFEDARPPAQSAMYFRGPVLSSFDGRQWRPSASATFESKAADAQLQIQGAGVRYQVTQEPSHRPWLVVLDATRSAPQLAGYQVSMTSDLQWITERPLTDIVRYSVQSFPDFRYGPQQANTQTLAALQEFTAQPRAFNPRTQALAAQLRSEANMANASTPQWIEAVMQRLRTGGYSYTLEPGVYGQHTADEFWFDRKAGFCEHIASSFVVLMRALNIPARIVTGYQGGEVNPVDGFWVVRQRDAHAWAEVWVAGQGWVRVDPTSAVAPARTGSFERLRVQPGVIANALGNVVSPAMALNMRALWEAMNNRWNQWVLNYTQSKQLDLLRNLGFASPQWEDLGYVLAGLLAMVGLLGAAWTLWERSRHDPWLQLLDKTAQRMREAGITLAANSGPQQMARALVDARGREPEVMALHDWLLQLQRWRYAPTPSGTAPLPLATLRQAFSERTQFLKSKRQNP